MPISALEESGLASELAGFQGPYPPTDSLSFGAAFCQIPHALLNLVDSQPTVNEEEAV